MRHVEQELTHVVTFRWVMRQRTFALGVADVRAKRSYHPHYDLWDGSAQWSYERGRMWATLTPRDLPLRRNGKINPNAVMWFARHTGMGNII